MLLPPFRLENLVTGVAVLKSMERLSAPPLQRKLPTIIRMKINELLGDRSHYRLAKATQIEYSVIRNLASQRSQRINYCTLDRLCVALTCELGELLVKVPEGSIA